MIDYLRKKHQGTTKIGPATTFAPVPQEPEPFGRCPPEAGFTSAVRMATRAEPREWGKPVRGYLCLASNAPQWSSEHPLTYKLPRAP